MDRKAIAIVIDGPVASGKSTTARLVAERLGYRCIDSGAIYRALTLKALRQCVDIQDEAAMGRLVLSTEVDLTQKDRKLTVLLDGEDVSEQIRLPEVTNSVAPVSEMKSVREIIVQRQRELGKDKAIVMEGRDTGTVVFPDAELKIFLTADIRERAKRRHLELKSKGIHVAVNELEEDIRERDRRNVQRKYGPERRSEDAQLLDTTGLTVDEQVDRIVQMAEELIQNKSKGEDTLS